MAPERSVALPLSMGEVVEAIAEAVRKACRRDCNLNPDLACQWFEAKVHIDLKHSDVGRVVETVVDAAAGHGEKTDLADGATIEEAAVDVEMGQAPPNKVRQDSGQPVPVLTTASGKPEIKKVQYKRPGTFQS